MSKRTKLSIGFGLATAWLWTTTPAFAQLGGGSTGGASTGGGGSSVGGGGGGGGGSGGGGGGSGGSSGQNGGSVTSGSIANDSILNSFSNAGTGRTTSSLSQTNLFSTTYMNPYQQGLLVSNGQNFTFISNSGFGQAVFGTITTGSTGGGTGGSARSSFGTNGASTAGRGGTGTSFGGTSTGGMSSFGSTGATGRVGTTGGSFGSGMTGTSGTRTGTTGTGTTFAGGNFGASIGRTGPIIGSTVRFNTPVRLEVEHRGDLQSMVNRSITSIKAPEGVNVGMNQGVVILRGNVMTSDEKRLVENMLRLQPGVREVRNELEVRSGNP